MQLVIAEKPSVARDLARVLGVRAGGEHAFEGDRFVITWCIGHLVELDEPAAYDPRWKAWRLANLPMLPETFQLRAASHARAQLRAVAKLLRERRFASVINACDAGREGELIFRYVYQYAGARLRVERLWVSSLTDDAIRRGFAALRPGSVLEPLADAARSRSEADWLVGMNATRAITARGRDAGHDALYSIGRVQTPTLAMLVTREHAIRAFVPRPYWEVRGDLRTADGHAFSARWMMPAEPGAARMSAGRLATRELARAVVARDTACRAAAHADGPRVERVRARTVREPPPLLFDLTSLQRTANRRFGWAAARTLELAQALYERHKVLTYPRTDSRHLSTDVARELPALFGALAAVPDYAPFAGRLVAQPPRPGRRVIDDGKVSDHHAIIPTQKPAREGALDRDERRLYDLVVRRFLGAFFPDAEVAVTDVWIRVGPGTSPTPAFVDDGDEPRGGQGASAPRAPSAGRSEPVIAAVLPPPPDRYLARGRVRLVAGWQEVAGIGERAAAGGGAGAGASTGPGGPRDGDADADALATLPPLVEGQRLDGSFADVAKQTAPPPRYTEATLLGAMETAGKVLDDEALRAAMKDRGLGTPATRAAIIETLLRRAYVVRDKQHLVPTAMGIALIDSLIATPAIASLASPELTGSWEARLAAIARGHDARAAFMADIARYVADLVDAIRGAPPPAPLPPGTAPQPQAWGGGGRTGGRGRGARGERGRRAARGGRSFARGTAPERERDTARARGDAPARGVARERGEAAAPAQRAIERRGGASATRAPRVSRRDARAQGGAPAGTALELACPRCAQGPLITGARGWGCARWREGCGFVIWFEIAGKRITPAQLRDLVTRGRTRPARFAPEGTPRAGRLVLDVRAVDAAVRFEPT